MSILAREQVKPRRRLWRDSRVSGLRRYDAASAFGASGVATAGAAFAAFFDATLLTAFFDGAVDFSFFAAAQRLR